MQATGQIRVGAFEFDVSTGDLRKGGLPVHLQDQPARILAALLEHPGEVVSREDLVRLLWPHGTFVDFDRGLNAAINRLRQALSDSAEHPRYVETVAKRGYRLIAPVESPGSDATTADAKPQTTASRWKRLPYGIAGLGIVGIAAAVWLAAWPTPTSVPREDLTPLSPAQLTSYRGIENNPSFSPDASQVAFSWDGENEHNQDIYVKLVGAWRNNRLTTHPAADTHPAWSPDGRHIAFHRAGHGIYLTTPIGGTERPLVASPDYDGQLSWTRDSKHLAFARTAPDTGRLGIFLAAADGDDPRKLLSEEGADVRVPAFSPDGRRLAFVRCTVVYSCVLSVVDLTSDYQIAGTIKQLMEPGCCFHSVAWTMGGEQLVLSSLNGTLVRVDVRGDRKPEILSFAGRGAKSGATASGKPLLAYQRDFSNIDLMLVEGGVLSPSPLSSSGKDSHPQYSPDGKQVAFASARSGNPEIWVGTADGAELKQLTTSIWSGMPRWSPDGKRIAYDTMDANGLNIYTVSVSDMRPKPIVVHSDADFAPCYSWDGKWIYFTSDRTGNNEIYRVPADGGAEERLTDNGGFMAVESWDRRSIYYLKSRGCGPLFQRALTGSDEIQIVENACYRGLVVNEKGIYYLSVPGNIGRPTPATCTVSLYDPQTGKSTIVAKTDQPVSVADGLAVSHEGNSILIPVTTQRGADLMLVENFH